MVLGSQCIDRMQRTIVLVSLGLLAACNDHPLKPAEYERYSGKSVTLSVDPHRDVDILFVIDNSGSMAEEQATLAANFGAFIDVLEDPNVAANYRIAITTTDNGHPHCSSTGPEGGNFVLSSCRSRISQFQSQPGTQEPVDARDVACNDLCPAELADLTTVPSALHRGGEEVARPWLESIDGRTNLPEGVDTATAFACLGPQGIDGCGYEAPLEAMQRALTRATTQGEDELGFMRDDALLAVVFVTDEVDCSVQPGMGSVFDLDGDRVLWSDPTADQPTSAVCWNAGTSCEDAGDGTLSCTAANIGVDGRPTDEAGAVLHPLSRYVNRLQDIENRKREVTGNQELDVLVSLIAGVPTGGGEVVYAHGGDAQFETDYGIAAGCSSVNGEAVPPVRLLELAATFAGEETNVYSVCDADYTPALREIARRFAKEFEPACVNVCPQDMDRQEDGHQNDCVVTETTADGEETRVPECVEQADGTRTLPDGADVCVWLAIDDERDDRCIDGRAPAEFRTIFRPDAPRKAGAKLEATCSVSDNEAVDCPWA